LLLLMFPPHLFRRAYHDVGTGKLALFDVDDPLRRLRSAPWEANPELYLPTFVPEIIYKPPKLREIPD